MDKVTKSVSKRVPPAKGGSRKGIPNKQTAQLKDMILTALEKAGGKAGGVGYLTEQAKANPKSFLALVGRVLPMQVTGDGGGPIQITIASSDADL